MHADLCETVLAPVCRPFSPVSVLTTIPDISATGPHAYTLSYSTMFSTNDSSAAHTLLELRQVNYRASVVVDGVSVSPVHTPTSDGAAVGMFRRFYFDLGHLAAGDRTSPVSTCPQPSVGMGTTHSPPPPLPRGHHFCSGTFAWGQ